MSSHPHSQPANASELLPCPFCAGVPSYAFEEGVWHLVRCTNLKCGTHSGIFPTKPMAVRAWNTRASAVSSAEGM